MGKRNVMNLLLVGAIGLPATSLVGGFAYFFVPPGCVSTLVHGAARRPRVSSRDRAIGSMISLSLSTQQRGGIGRRNSIAPRRSIARSIARLDRIADARRPHRSPPPLLYKSQRRRRRRRPSREGRAGQRRQEVRVAQDAPPGRPHAHAGSQGARRGSLSRAPRRDDGRASSSVVVRGIRGGRARDRARASTARSRRLARPALGSDKLIGRSARRARLSLGSTRGKKTIVTIQFIPSFAIPRR